MTFRFPGFMVRQPTKNGSRNKLQTRDVKWVAHVSLLRPGCSGQDHQQGETHVSKGRCGARAVVSHISRKTSEMWGTRRLVAGMGPKACSFQPAGPSTP